MTINLNDENEFNLANVRRLIASKDDSLPRQIRVTTEGRAFLSDVTGKEDIESLAFRFETYDAGNDYVGKRAAEDDHWVETVYGALKANWPVPSSTYVDIY